MATPGDIDIVGRLKQAAAMLAGTNPGPGLSKLLLAGGGGALVGGGLATALTSHVLNERAEAERARTRNVSFGAGAAAGLAAPHLVQALNARLNPSGGGQ